MKHHDNVLICLGRIATLNTVLDEVKHKNNNNETPYNRICRIWQN